MNEHDPEQTRTESPDMEKIVVRSSLTTLFPALYYSIAQLYNFSFQLLHKLPNSSQRQNISRARPAPPWYGILSDAGLI